MKRFFRLLIVLCPTAFVFSLTFAAPAAVPAAGGRTKTVEGLIISGLRGDATNYLKSGQEVPAGIGYGAFDEFSNINDPLYREGSKEFLKASSLNDEASKTVKVSAFRDAPSDGKGKTAGKKRSSRQKNNPVIKKRKTVKSPHVYPVKSNRE